MKKRILLLGAVLSISAILTGCGTDDVVDDVAPKDAIYVIDQNGQSVGGIPYTCIDGNNGVTDGNGAFYFWVGTKCDLELDVPVADSLVDILHLEDDYGTVEGVNYICDNGDFGQTNSAGIFNFDNTNNIDVCTFNL